MASPSPALLRCPFPRCGFNARYGTVGWLPTWAPPAGSSPLLANDGALRRAEKERATRRSSYCGDSTARSNPTYFSTTPRQDAKRKPQARGLVVQCGLVGIRGWVRGLVVRPRPCLFLEVALLRASGRNNAAIIYPPGSVRPVRRGREIPGARTPHPVRDLMFPIQTHLGVVLKRPLHVSTWSNLPRNSFAH